MRTGPSPRLYTTTLAAWFVVLLAIVSATAAASTIAEPTKATLERIEIASIHHAVEHGADRSSSHHHAHRGATRSVAPCHDVVEMDSCHSDAAGCMDGCQAAQACSAACVLACAVGSASAVTGSRPTTPSLSSRALSMPRERAVRCDALPFPPLFRPPIV